jgi:hypothetical protein
MKKLALLTTLIMFSLVVFSSNYKSTENDQNENKSSINSDNEKMVNDGIITNPNLCDDILTEETKTTEIEGSVNIKGDLKITNGKAADAVEMSNTTSSGTYYDIFSEIECVKPIVTIMIMLT